MRNLSEYCHKQLKVERQEPQFKDYEVKTIIGLITLEDVIEKTLRIDIVDEGDLDEAKRAFGMRNESPDNFNEDDLKSLMQMKYV